MYKKQEKLFRLKHGYAELQGDEITGPYLEDHYRGVKHISDLSLAEKTAFNTREYLLNQGDMPCESFNQTIDDAVLYALYEHETISHDHVWKIKSWNAYGFWIWRKYDVRCTCRICGFEIYFKRLNLREWRELMISQHDTKELTKNINKLINKDK